MPLRYAYGPRTTITQAISGTTDAFTLSEIAALVRLNSNFAATRDQFTLTEAAASILRPYPFSATRDQLTLTELAASISAGGVNFTAQSGYVANGTFVDGGTITISRGAGGFGTKPNDAKPLLWVPFTSNGNPSSLGRSTSGYLMEHGAFTASGGVDGGGCYQGTATNSGDPDGSSERYWGGEFYSTHFGQLSAKTYLYAKCKKNFAHLDYNDDNTKNIKSPFRFFHWNGVTNVAPTFYISPSNGRVGDPAATDSDWTWDYGQRGDADGYLNEWYTSESLLQANTATNLFNAVLKHYVKGGPERVTFPNTTWKVNGFKLNLGSGNLADKVYFPEYACEGDGAWVPPPHGSRFWFDDVYIDDSWCRVFIQDSATFNTATNREIQIPSAWSDTSVTVTVRKGEFASLAGKHVWIANNSDTKFYAGVIT